MNHETVPCDLLGILPEDCSNPTFCGLFGMIPLQIKGGGKATMIMESKGVSNYLSTSPEDENWFCTTDNTKSSDRSLYLLDNEYNDRYDIIVDISDSIVKCDQLNSLCGSCSERLFEQQQTCANAMPQIAHETSPLTCGEHIDWRAVHQIISMDTCETINNNICEDGGGMNNVESKCEFGSDATDCARQDQDRYSTNVNGIYKGFDSEVARNMIGSNWGFENCIPCSTSPAFLPSNLGVACSADCTISPTGLCMICKSNPPTIKINGASTFNTLQINIVQPDYDVQYCGTCSSYEYMWDKIWIQVHNVSSTLILSIPQERQSFVVVRPICANTIQSNDGYYPTTGGWPWYLLPASTSQNDTFKILVDETLHNQVIESTTTDSESLGKLLYLSMRRSVHSNIPSPPKLLLELNYQENQEAFDIYETLTISKTPQSKLTYTRGQHLIVITPSSHSYNVVLRGKNAAGTSKVSTFLTVHGKLELRRITLLGFERAVVARSGSDVIITDCRFEANDGAISFVGGTATIQSTSFVGNVAVNAAGGSILNGVGSVLTLHQSIFQSSSSIENDGGALMNHGVTNISSSSFAKCSANIGIGGAVHNMGSMTIQDTIISSSTAMFGGGIASTGENGQISLLYSNITECVASNRGGGIFVSAGNKTTITLSKLFDNKISTNVLGLKHVNNGQRRVNNMYEMLDDIHALPIGVDLISVKKCDVYDVGWRAVADAPSLEKCRDEMVRHHHTNFVYEARVGWCGSRTKDVTLSFERTASGCNHASQWDDHLRHFSYANNFQDECLIPCQNDATCRSISFKKTSTKTGACYHFKSPCLQIEQATLTVDCPLNEYCNLNKILHPESKTLIASKTSHCTGNVGGNGVITTDNFITQNQYSTYRILSITTGKIHIVHTKTNQSQLSDRKLTCGDPFACPTNTSMCEEDTQYSGEGVKCWGCLPLPRQKMVDVALFCDGRDGIKTHLLRTLPKFSVPQEYTIPVKIHEYECYGIMYSVDGGAFNTV